MGWGSDYQVIITLPTGATSGQRIVLDGTTGLIEVYNSSGVLVDTLGGPDGDFTMGTSSGNGTINLSAALGQINIQNSVGNSQIILDGPSQSITIKDLTTGEFVQLTTGAPQITFADPNGNVTQGGVFLGGGATPVQPFLGFLSPSQGSGLFNDPLTMGMYPGKSSGTRAKAVWTDYSAAVDADMWVSGAMLSCNLTGSTVNTWQSPTLGSGWASGPVAGSFMGLKYRLDAMDNLVVVGTIHSTSTSPAANVFTLPSGFRPAQGQRVPCAANQGGTYSLHSMEISTAGVINIDPAFTVSGADLYVEACVPMGNIA